MSGRIPLLVNRAHPLVRPVDPALLAPVDRSHPHILLQREAAIQLRRLLASLSGAGRIIPVSGWRSHAEQVRLYQDALREHGRAFTETYVAYPGCSEHETGFAIDLGEDRPDLDFIRPSFPDTGVCALFSAKAPKFGFILRYPAGKEAVTGIGWEPWHFRYVGPDHAQAITEAGLTLEEYVAQLEGAAS